MYDFLREKNLKLLQTIFDENFEKTVRNWAENNCINGNSALFHVYVPYDAEDRENILSNLRAILKSVVPDASIIGCSATGELSNGTIEDSKFVVSVIIFEEATTSVHVMPSHETEVESNASWFLEYEKDIPNLKGIEVLTSANNDHIEAVGNAIDLLSEEVEFFGGVAVGDEKNLAFVFSNDGELIYDGSVFVFFSGSDLHIQTNRMFGWKPIGYPLMVTKAEGSIIYELDNKPAYDVYNHYLQIKLGENFFYDALTFPWEVKVDDDTKYIRHAKSVNKDGSIIMSSTIPEGSEIRITYGDPRRIFEHTRRTAGFILDFGPQVVNIINCFGRKLFWSDKENVEIREISKKLQTTGFSALGEIMRYNGTTILNNLSIVTVAMREGPKGKRMEFNIEELQNNRSMSVSSRLAIFINTITEELMEKNQQLNDMLYKASHDALTGLYNRGTIERAIYDHCSEEGEIDAERYLIMLDIDDFKMINDRYGHAKGDYYLRLVSDILTRETAQYVGTTVGRWGGEEFMICLENMTTENVKAIAYRILESIRNDENNDKGITVSIGVTKYIPGENIQQMMNRVDELLYEAKNNGKNQVRMKF